MDNKTNNENYFIFGTTDLFIKTKENLKKTNKRPRDDMAHLSNTAITQIKAAIYSNQNSFVKSHTSILASVVTVVVISTFKN